MEQKCIGTLSLENEKQSTRLRKLLRTAVQLDNLAEKSSTYVDASRSDNAIIVSREN